MLYINEDGTIRLTRGEVANAPLGATNATITYNYTAE